MPAGARCRSSGTLGGEKHPFVLGRASIGRCKPSLWKHPPKFEKHAFSQLACMSSSSYAFFKLFLYQAASQRTRALQEELHAATMAISDEANQNDKLEDSSDTSPASKQPPNQESTLADAKHNKDLNNAIKEIADLAFKQGGPDKSLQKDE